MTNHRDHDYLLGLVRELCNLPHETDWVEFKVNYRKPHAIGEYISALANAAALHGKAHAYMLWGIENGTHVVAGTNFSPSTAKKSNEPLETWLLRLLRPRIDFRFHEVTVEERRVVLLEINRASQHPVAFEGVEFIRVGSTTRRLKDYPEKERTLWRVFDRMSFEDGLAAERLSDEDVLLKLDYAAYFDLLDAPLPDGRAAILDALRRDRLIAPCEAGGFNITNLGAILFARNLGDFPRLKRKAMRVVEYRGEGRLEALGEREETKGYASGFDGLISYINARLPTHEVIGPAFRRTIPEFPELAVRELVANALIHQDFFATGVGPMVEIFKGRIEITNPGEPLVDTQRFLDTPPASRNEVLTSLMRRFQICEERGTGIDKVVAEVERYQLPAPLFEVPPNFTRVVLFAHKALTHMDKAERVRACYLHACLKYVTRGFLTNASLRERFGIKENNRAAVSRYIREAVDVGLIRPFDEQASKKMMKYVPFWA
jgi:predicted HTH transcriptional regulator